MPSSSSTSSAAACPIPASSSAAHHISALPLHLPSAADVGVIGEGEHTFLDLMRSLGPDNAWTDDALAGISGICYRQSDGRVAVTAPRPLCRELDSLPFPLRTVNPSATREAVIFTSRGCPFRCSYCSTRGYWESYRRFSAPYVIAELEHIVQAFPEVTSVWILDDLYVADRKRLREMVRMMDQRGLNRRLRFHGFVRSSLVDEELCELLKQMNVDAIRFGAESGSDAVLQRMERGGKCSVATHQRAIDLAHKWGFACTASFMLGFPGETRPDLQATFDFIARNRGKLSVSGLYLAVPLPGTELWKWAEDRGMVGETMDWSRLNLAFGNPDFDWDNFLYLNDEALPRDEFVALVRGSGLLPDQPNSVHRPAEAAETLRRLRDVLAVLAERGARRVALYGAGEHTRRIAQHLAGLHPRDRRHPRRRRNPLLGTHRRP